MRKLVFILIVFMLCSCRVTRDGNNKYNIRDKEKRYIHFHVIIGGTFYGHWGDYNYKR